MQTWLYLFNSIIYVYIMSHSFNNHDDNHFHETQHKEASNLDEHERKKESITLKLLKTIFESTLRKMELAVALPSIILDPELPMILTKCELGMINDIFVCDTEHCSACLLKSAFEQKEHSLRKRETTKTHCQTTWNMSRFDHAVYRALKILNKHIDVLYPCDKYISMPSALFLHYLRCFLQHALCKLNLTPGQARSKELHYRQLWRDQERSIKDSNVFTRHLEKQRSNHEKLLENVIEQYNKNLAIVDEINKKCDEDMANTTVKYEKEQLMLYKIWEIEQNEVQLALNSITDDLESLKNINANVEEAVYNRRLAVESKLLAVLTKYDTEIGSRYRTLEELSQIYENDKLEKLALEQELKEQEEAYVALLGATDFYERLATLYQERSATSIQRWWRRILDKTAKR